MIKFTSSFSYSASDQQEVARLLASVLSDANMKNIWDDKEYDTYHPWLKSAVSKLKQNIKLSLITNNGNFCSYCFYLSFKSSELRIDHFAIKAYRRDTSGQKQGYPEFTFEPQNLLLACKSCNEDYKKSFDVIRKPAAATYSACSFNVYHPYLDNLGTHFRVIGSLKLASSSKAKNYVQMITNGIDSRYEAILKNMKNLKAHLSQEQLDNLNMALSYPKIRRKK